MSARLPRPPAAALAAALAAVLTATGAAGEVAELLDGSRVEGVLVALDDAQVRLRTPAGERAIARAEIAELAFGREAGELAAAKGRQVLVAEDGSMLACRSLALADGAIAVGLGWGQALSVPAERAARILRPKAHQTPDDVLRARGRERVERGEQDQLLVSDAAGKQVRLGGTIEGLTPAEVLFTYEGAATRLAADSVVLIEFARLGAAAPAAKGAAEVVCVDGSRIAAQAVTLAGARLDVRSASLGTLAVPLAEVAVLRLAAAGGGRVVALGELTPAAVEQVPFLDEEFPHRVDRALDGGPLLLGGRAYARGLALHARCTLTWDLDGSWRRLDAVAGIDDGVAAGAALLSVIADGKPVAGPLRLERTQKPQRLRVDLAGVRRLQVVVDFADARLGAGARVNLCDANLVK